MESKNIFSFVKEWTNRCKGWQYISNAIEKELLVDDLIANTNYLNTDSSIKKRLWHIINDVSEPIICYCGESKKFTHSIVKGYFKSCGKLECAKKSEESTCITKYGNKSAMNNIDVMKKFKDTHMKRYGVDSYLKTKNIKEDRKKSFIEKFELLNKNVKISDCREFVSFKCENCNDESKIRRFHFVQRRHKNICYKCVPLRGTASIKELELLNWIKSITSLECLSSYKIPHTNGKELDVYIPEINFAIEFNGIYWHTERWIDKNYHLNKLKLCQENNINLFYIWEDDWENPIRKEIIKSMIRNKLHLNASKIYARKCIIKEVNAKDSNLFLETNHIQGKVNGSIKIGLYFENKLVSLMTFGKKRKIMNSIDENKNNWELLRFCNLLDTNVIGGASKLLKYFNKTYNPNEIISYANLDRSNGKLYEILGFRKLFDSPPNYWWVYGGRRYYRYNFRKDILVKYGFDKSKSENEIMNERGFYKLWNCGNSKWIMKF